MPHEWHISAGKRLLHQRRVPVRRRQLLTAIAADKREGNVARLQRIGNPSHRLAGKMGVEQRAMDVLPLDGVKRVADRAGRPDYGETRLLEHGGDIESDQELVLDDENARCCHRLGASRREVRVSFDYSIQSRPPRRPSCIGGTGLTASAFFFHL